MPRGDQTGPVGAGPMTGRRAGHCTGSARAGWQNPVQGRRGGAQRRSWGFNAFPRDYQTAIPPKTDISHTALHAEREVLRGQLEAIEQELAAIDAKEEKIKQGHPL